MAGKKSVTNVCTQVQKTTTAVTARLTQQWKELKAVVPKHVTPERIARVAVSSISKVPKLAECSPESITKAIWDAATLGLEVNDGTGRAWLVPSYSRQNGYQANLMIGYPGLVELSYRSGHVKTLYAYAVFKGDDFKYTFGLEPQITHVPCGESNPLKLTHVYAVVRLKDGGFLFEVMTRKQIENIRKRSRNGRTGPWHTDYVEMARKTAIRRVCKQVPLSVELQKAVCVDEESEFGPHTVVSDEKTPNEPTIVYDPEFAGGEHVAA